MIELNSWLTEKSQIDFLLSGLETGVCSDRPNFVQNVTLYVIGIFVQTKFEDKQ